MYDLRNPVLGAAIALTTVMMLTVFSSFPASAQNSTLERPARNAHDLEQMVRQDCGSCHGMTFKGGLGSPLLPENIAHYSIDDLTTIILDGLPGTAMPPWRAIVTPDEAAWMARYLKTGDPE
ncbi:c-type cytochrome [Thalassospira alkalitolerans]|nr:cytochrome c [Thalassospira alkalitolerans]